PPPTLGEPTPTTTHDLATLGERHPRLLRRALRRLLPPIPRRYDLFYRRPGHPSYGQCLHGALTATRTGGPRRPCSGRYWVRYCADRSEPLAGGAVSALLEKRQLMGRRLQCPPNKQPFIGARSCLFRPVSPKHWIPSEVALKCPPARLLSSDFDDSSD